MMIFLSLINSFLIKDAAKWLNKNTKTKVKSGKLISLEDLNAIKKKYGKNALLKGADLQEGATTRDRNKMIGGHNA